MILIIDNYDSFTYNLYQIVASLCNDVEVIRNDKITVAEIRKLNPAAIVLSPGPGRPEQAGICIAAIKELYNQIPILGVCLGHQAIAMAFGGKVVQCNNIVHGKTTNVFHYRQSIYKDMPLPFTAGRYHSLIVERDTLPDSLLIEAENNEGIVMGIKHINFPVHGVQFHPESILTPEGNKLVYNFLQEAKAC